MCHLLVDIMSLLFKRLERLRFQILTLIEVLGPILVRRFNPIIGQRDLEGGGPLTDDELRQTLQGFDRDKVAPYCYS